MVVQSEMAKLLTKVKLMRHATVARKGDGEGGEGGEGGDDGEGWWRGYAPYVLLWLHTSIVLYFYGSILL
jgi:hypothetical protein